MALAPVKILEVDLQKNLYKKEDADLEIHDNNIKIYQL